jgi:hypothetical protein
MASATEQTTQQSSARRMLVRGIAVTGAAMVVILSLELRLDDIGDDGSGSTTHDLAHLAVHQLIAQKGTSSPTSYGC